MQFRTNPVVWRRADRDGADVNRGQDWAIEAMGPPLPGPLVPGGQTLVSSGGARFGSGSGAPGEAASGDSGLMPSRVKAAIESEP